MNVLVPVYQRKDAGYQTWTALALGVALPSRRFGSEAKLREHLGRDLEAALAANPPHLARVVGAPRSVSLERVRLEL